jgi:D-alanyl-D-alanine carboxypeptidase
VSQNRAVLFAGSILIALLIIVPLLANFSSGSLVTTIQDMGNDTNNASGINSQHANMPGIAPDTDHPAPPVYATAAFLLDADSGAMLYEHNGSLRLPMMSTTKLMTGLLASQYGGNQDRKITINDSIANDINQLSADSSVMGAKRGETYTLRELLYGLMLPSGNDAALIIADTVSGSVQKFVDLMNQRAQELALHDTHYENPHGLLADGHYSSAHDLAVLDKAVMDVPVLRQITGTKAYHIPATNEHAEHYFTNGNQFMWWYPGVDGGKIGWDGGANFVQVVSVTRNKHHLIGVAMHTINWWTDMRDMMNWGFNTFTWLSPREINASGLSIPYAADWNYFARDQRDYSIPLNNQGRYYVFTGYTVTQPIIGFFDKNGGLTKLGFPISQPQTTNNTLLQQRFEHGTIQCDQGSKQCKKA